ncbi:hypothetical protein MSL71_45810 [Desulfoluna butyratoxydans]|uniref:Uncharacterized protein n=2 Tax=Desulfoluna butyratoxydans TaxID=231438 RepID=A0A4U8YU32_9BACT|nr:hypothetical protein MSL71_45810 [Desulfoluna butyratoxydans]
MGAGVAYCTVWYQERIQIYKKNIDACNRILLSADEAISELISLKHNYHGKLSNNPFQRATAIPYIVFSSKPISVNLPDISFIVPQMGNSNNSIYKWSQIPRIRNMFNNYNFLIDAWNKRNEIYHPILEKIRRNTQTEKSPESNDRSRLITNDDVYEVIDISEFARLIDLTETVIKLTDIIIAELNDFLINFPDMIDKMIITKRKKHHASIFRFINENNKREEIIKHSLEVDFTILSNLLEEPVDSIKNRYNAGYE